MNKKYKILYLEDDETLAYLTNDSLQMQNYQVLHIKNGEEAIQVFEQNDIDICILDIMVPGKDGFEIAKAIRALNVEVPIIFLSAKTLKEDRILGLKLGADDYLVKPFSIEELVLKIEIFLQRSKKQLTNKNVYTIGGYFFDSKNYTVYFDEEETILTLRESDLLKLFVENEGKVLRREDILKNLWGTDDYFMGRSLDVFISRLRKILTKDKRVSIENLHRIGFKFEVR